jgi:hypothetical protein
MPVRRKTGLLLVGVGVVFSFLVTSRVSGFDPRTAGYLMIMAGVLSAALPRRPAARARRGVLVRYYYRQTQPPSGRARDQEAPR